jgi:hypothetical protein
MNKVSNPDDGLNPRGDSHEPSAPLPHLSAPELELGYTTGSISKKGLSPVAAILENSCDAGGKSSPKAESLFALTVLAALLDKAIAAGRGGESNVQEALDYLELAVAAAYELDEMCEALTSKEDGAILRGISQCVDKCSELEKVLEPDKKALSLLIHSAQISSIREVLAKYGAESHHTITSFLRALALQVDSLRLVSTRVDEAPKNGPESQSHSLAISPYGPDEMLCHRKVLETWAQYEGVVSKSLSLAVNNGEPCLISSHNGRRLQLAPETRSLWTSDAQPHLAFFWSQSGGLSMWDSSSGALYRLPLPEIGVKSITFIPAANSFYISCSATSPGKERNRAHHAFMVSLVGECQRVSTLFEDFVTGEIHCPPDPRFRIAILCQEESMLQIGILEVGAFRLGHRPPTPTSLGHIDTSGFHQIKFHKSGKYLAFLDVKTGFVRSFSIDGRVIHDFSTAKGSLGVNPFKKDSSISFGYFEDAFKVLKYGSLDNLEAIFTCWSSVPVEREILPGFEKTSIRITPSPNEQRTFRSHLSQNGIAVDYKDSKVVKVSCWSYGNRSFDVEGTERWIESQSYDKVSVRDLHGQRWNLKFFGDQVISTSFVTPDLLMVGTEGGRVAIVNIANGKKQLFRNVGKAKHFAYLKDEVFWVIEGKAELHFYNLRTQDKGIIPFTEDTTAPTSLEWSEPVGLQVVHGSDKQLRLVVARSDGALFWLDDEHLLERKDGFTRPEEPFALIRIAEGGSCGLALTLLPNEQTIITRETLGEPHKQLSQKVERWISDAVFSPDGRLITGFHAYGAIAFLCQEDRSLVQLPLTSVMDSSLPKGTDGLIGCVYQHLEGESTLSTQKRSGSVVHYNVSAFSPPGAYPLLQSEEGERGGSLAPNSLQSFAAYFNSYLVSDKTCSSFYEWLEENGRNLAFEDYIAVSALLVEQATQSLSYGPLENQDREYNQFIASSVERCLREATHTFFEVFNTCFQENGLNHSDACLAFSSELRKNPTHLKAFLTLRDKASELVFDLSGKALIPQRAEYQASRVYLKSLLDLQNDILKSITEVESSSNPLKSYLASVDYWERGKVAVDIVTQCPKHLLPELAEKMLESEAIPLSKELLAAFESRLEKRGMKKVLSNITGAFDTWNGPWQRLVNELHRRYTH